MTQSKAEEMEKQARELFIEKCSEDLVEPMWTGNDVIKFAASFAAQVREQSIAAVKDLVRHPESCAAFMERKGYHCTCGLNAELDAIAAPPVTSQGQGE